ncbi:MAG: PglZ domain-containing protein [Fidelibacterota bacterium]|nr:MAG: PglZ domain-containing protein [Candidatus Neomarinimicrobiota bacterium]
MVQETPERGRILWADDEIDLLKPHILFLEEQGYAVTPVHSGEDALHEVKKGEFSLVLLDEMMDGMDGLHTLQEIKALHPALPVIMITKNEEEWLMDEAIGANIAGYLTKPVNPSQIFMVCKSMLERTRIRSDKAASRYLEAFQELSQRVESASTLEQWITIFKELTSWDVEFDTHRDLGLDQLLAEQHQTASQRFGQLVMAHYRDWLEGSTEFVFSHQVLDEFVTPHLQAGSRVVLVVVDCLRLDQWKAMRSLLEDRFTIEEQVHLSILPTATPFSRNAIFSGLLPDQLPKRYPEKWREMARDESSMNKFESTFLEDYLERKKLKGIQNKYFKLITAEEGQRLLARLPEYSTAQLLALVVNFVDLLAHHRAESDVIKEILPDESGYRATICSWLEKSWMRELLDIIAQWEDTIIVLTSDHGSIQVDRPIRILADRQTSSGVRYKYGRNLSSPEKGGLTIKHPADYHLPADDVTTNYVIARDRNFFVYPTDYHRFVKRFEGSFQHGGISLEEMVLPVATLRPRNI